MTFKKPNVFVRLDQFINENSNKQTSTSSYISDDCKVLYIETVIEVAKPVFYERNSETTTTSNTEYHHHHPQQQQQQQQIADSSTSTATSTRNFAHLYSTDRRRTNESSDDEFSKPVNFKTSNRRHEQMEKISQMDSGIEYDHTSPPASSSSSSTIFNQRSLDTTHQDDQRLFIPPVPNSNDEIRMKNVRDQTQLMRRNISTGSNTNRIKKNLATAQPTPVKTSTSCSTRLKQICFRSFLVGLLLLFILFFVYFSRLDSCSRRTLIQSICEKIICIEHDGLPTI